MDAILRSLGRKNPAGTVPEAPYYSQVGEDKVIEFVVPQFASGRTIHSYIDVGANEPVTGSNTYHFYLTGAKGVLIEPNPALCERLRRERPNDTVVNAGVGLPRDQAAIFYVCEPSFRDLSTFSEQRVAEIQARGVTIEAKLEIPIMTLETVIERFFPDGRVDLVSVDVEGSELEVLQSTDLTTHRPLCFCVEANFADFTYGRPHPIIAFMESRDYLCIANTSINLVFLDGREYRHPLQQQ